MVERSDKIVLPQMVLDVLFKGEDKNAEAEIQCLTVLEIYPNLEYGLEECKFRNSQ